MVDIRERLGIERRIVQAPFAGGIARAELASAVSRAGGLGTVGTVQDPAAFRDELRRCRDLCGKFPFAANLLFPITRREHVTTCVEEKVPVVSLFFGADAQIVRALHDAGSLVLHQVGSVEQARRALHDGADVVVVQGAGAGGHVLAEAPLEHIVPEVVDLAGEKPVLASGGIHDRTSAERALSLGAAGVWVGTRFLLTDESDAHDAYKARLVAANETFETHLFGVGWHALHRVVPNAATRRWCAENPLGPVWVRTLQRIIEPIARRAPAQAEERVIAAQSVRRPFFSPMALTRGMNPEWVDVTPLYAGNGVVDMHDVRPAAVVVRDLAV